MSPDPCNALTEREFEVLQLIALHHLTDHEVASRLVLSDRTVNAHVRNILKKLHASDRREAARHFLSHENR